MRSKSESKEQKSRIPGNQDTKIEKAKISITLLNQPARFIKSLKQRGLAFSNRDIVVRALLALEEQMVALDLRKSELQKQEANNASPEY